MDSKHHKDSIQEMMEKKYLNFHIKGRICYISEDLFLIISGLKNCDNKSYIAISQLLADRLLKQPIYKKAYASAIKKHHNQDIFKEVLLYGDKSNKR